MVHCAPSRVRLEEVTSIILLLPGPGPLLDIVSIFGSARTTYSSESRRPLIEASDASAMPSMWLQPIWPSN